MLAPPHTRTATLFRMVMPEHVCPYGIKARWLLRRHGYTVDDHWLTSRAATDAFKREQDVATTPQVYIAGHRIGGYDGLRQYFGKPAPAPDATSYVPVLAVSAAALAMALAASFAAFGTVFTARAAEWFLSFGMVLLAMLKLQDVERFSTMVLGYDLIAQRWVPYGYAYPFLEFTAGTLMAAHALAWLSVPIALIIGTIGAASVINAVWIRKRKLKCACVGGSSRVPLGPVSLAENLAMIGMGLWMMLGG